MGLEMLKLLAREMAFRALCRHRQGPRPNILLYCTRRGGSTWLLNTLACEPGMRYVGRPFLAILQSRWAGRMPPLRGRHIVAFEGEDEERFRRVAAEVISGRLPIYPVLDVRAPYFQRVTDRIVLQMTSGPPLIAWFDREFHVRTLILFRHPVPNALSVIRLGWPHEAGELLEHPAFRERHLSGEQVEAAQRVLAEGSPLEQHVLDWCLKMLVPYREVASGDHPAWVAISYEQTVRRPEAVVRHLAERLDLSDVEAMLAQLRRPSRNVTSATSARVDDQAYLLSRWREQVDPAEERRVMSIPEWLGIDLYAPGRDDAAAPFLADLGA